MLSNIKRYLSALATVLFLATSGGGSEPHRLGIEVTLDRAKTLSLHATVTSNAKADVELATWRLPWGGVNSMILVAITPNKEYLEISRKNIPIIGMLDSSPISR